MKKSLLDLSLGGLAIVFPNSEKMFIKITKKTIIPLAILSVGARPIKIKIECTGLIEIDRFSLESLPYGGYKISFKFLDIGLEDKNFLVSHIAHEILLHESYKKIS